ncbi:hypothetical protein SSX86_008931 [Deinandra increscens subsp. villosa]|uniref:RRM domain-containing protein n=1 Tax=Deinandra increscens subsp. villosa TaxID=3103831 RepID=A0AAP0DH00_9ASTR
MSRSRSIRPHSRSRLVGRDRRYRGGRRDRSKGFRAGRDGSRVRFGHGDEDYGYERRGRSTRFSNTNSERFSHGEFDDYGTFHEYDYGGDSDFHANPRGWEKVTYRKTKYRTKSPAKAPAGPAKVPDGRWKDVDAWSSTVFVTNFPIGTTIKGLWDRCLAAGKVVDVFISDRLSSVGKKFAFVRFVKRVDLSNVIYKIRNVWIGSFRLFADVAKFKRGVNGASGGNGGTSGIKEVDGQAHPMPDIPLANEPRGPFTGVGVKFAEVGGKLGKDLTYLDALATHGQANRAVQSSGSNGVGEAGGVGNGGVKEVVKVANNVPVENFVSSRLLKVRDVKSMSILYHIAGQEGFSDVSFRYVGGWWVRVDCNSIDECAKFSNCQSFNSVFSECKRVCGDFVVKERMVWVNISGLPLGAWSSEAFTTIASKWGKVCFVDNDLEEPLACGKVCILTLSAKRINESIVCKVGDSVFDVSVSEHQYWTPIFYVPCDSEDGSSDEEGSAFSVEDIRMEKTNKGVIGLDRVEGGSGKEKVNSDPFGIMDFLNKKLPETNKNYSVSLSVPPGFERIVEGEDGVVNQRNEAKMDTPICVNKSDTEESINVAPSGSQGGIDGGVTSAPRPKDGTSVSDVVKKSWDDPIGNTHGNCFVRFKEKLKLLKSNLKRWNSGRIEADLGAVKELRSKLEDVEIRMEEGFGIEELNREKYGILNDLRRIERFKVQEVSQKIKSKWILEGDENSRFFHAFLKKRRRVNTVRGIKVNGDWLEEPLLVKNAFYEYHSVRFKEPNPLGVISLEGLGFKRLAAVVATDLCSAPLIGEVASNTRSVRSLVHPTSQPHAWRDVLGGRHDTSIGFGAPVRANMRSDRVTIAVVTLESKVMQATSTTVLLGNRLVSSGFDVGADSRTQSYAGVVKEGNVDGSVGLATVAGLNSGQSWEADMMMDLKYPMKEKTIPLLPVPNGVAPTKRKDLPDGVAATKLEVNMLIG